MSDLDRHIAVQVGIMSQIDAPLSAAIDLPHDDVFPDSLAGSECKSIGDVVRRRLLISPKALWRTRRREKAAADGCRSEGNLSGANEFDQDVRKWEFGDGWTCPVDIDPRVDRVRRSSAIAGSLRDTPHQRR